jgi:hypothetical protein
MGVGGVTVSRKKIIEALNKHNGIIARAAKELGIERNTIYNAKAEDPAVNEAIIQGRLKIISDEEDRDYDVRSLAYESIIALLAKFDVTATIFALKTKCKWEQPSNIGSSVHISIDDKGSMDAANKT